MGKNQPVQSETIERWILLIRGQRAMLGLHLAELYGVETRVLNQAVKRNRSRFPDDFVFQLSESEARRLVSQNVIPHWKYLGGTLPYAFTEQGVAMLSSVLRSDRAVQVNVAIMRVFVKLREILGAHRELAQKLAELEQKIEKHDSEIQGIFAAIRQLMQPPARPARKIGFRVEEPRANYQDTYARRSATD